MDNSFFQFNKRRFGGEKMTEENEENIKQDSFTLGTAATNGALKVYFDLSDTKEVEKKLTNFFKTKRFIDTIRC